MSASIVIRSPIRSHSKSVEPGMLIQDYILSYDEEMRKQAQFKRVYMPGELFGGVATDLYLNDAQTPIQIDDMTRPLQDGESIIIHHRPQGFDPITIAIAAIVAAVAIVALIPTPSIPKVNGQDIGERSESPNNRLSGQTNIARPYEAIPEIFGRIIAFPDLIQPSLFEYIGNIKYVREVFCIGRGEYQINQIRDDQTELSAVSGSSSTVYGPGSSPSDLRIGRESNDVDGQELIAVDDPRREYTGRIIFKDRSASLMESVTFNNTDDSFVFSSSTIAFDIDLNPGDTFDISGSVSHNGTWTISSINNDGTDTEIFVTGNVLAESPTTITVTPTITPPDRIYVDDQDIIDNFGLVNGSTVQITGTTSNNGTYTIVSAVESNIKPLIYEGQIAVTDLEVQESFTNEDDPSATIKTTESEWVGWFQLTGEMGAIWCHFQTPQGLQSSSGGTIQVDFEIETQETDSGGTPTGSVDTTTGFFRDSSLNPGFQTVKITVPSFGFYRIRARRTTDKFTGNAVDLLKWEEAVAITEYESDFGDVTLLDVTTKATAFALNSSQRKINVDCTRKLGTARSGSYVATPVATQTFADAVVYTLLKAGRDISEIDIDELYDIEDSAGSPYNEFNFSFDNKDIDLGERVKTICNAARVNVYRDGQTWRFVRDEAQANRTLSFNRRNIASGENQQQNYQLRKPNDFDGVSLRYIDPDTNKRAEIKIKIDPVTETFIEGQAGTRQKNIDLAGCRDETQARDRAHLEARRLLYQRRSVSETVLNDGNLVDLGDRVAWVDIFDGDTFDGEILGVNGSEYRTSERFDPAAGESYVVVITDSDGNTTNPVTATAGSTPFSFVATLPDSPILADKYTIQAGSRYIIGNVTDIGDTDMTVVAKRPQSGGRVKVEMINYTDKLYEMDGML